MATFKEAEQARLVLKMKLHNYSWYASSMVTIVDNENIILINSKRLDDHVRKLIPKVFNNVGVKIELEH